MNWLLRATLAFVGLLLLASWIVPFGSITWADWFLNDRIYSVPFGWLSWASLIAWAYYALAFLGLGIALQLLAPGRYTLYLAFALGGLYTVDRFVRSHYRFFAAATASDYFWMYGELVVPPVASLIGAYICERWSVARAASTKA
jgi:hypothetical protein